MLELALQTWLLLTAACLVLLIVVIAARSVRVAARRARAVLREQFTVTLSIGGNKAQLYPPPDAADTA